MRYATFKKEATNEREFTLIKKLGSQPQGVFFALFENWRLRCAPTKIRTWTRILAESYSIQLNYGGTSQPLIGWVKKDI